MNGPKVCPGHSSATQGQSLKLGQFHIFWPVTQTRLNYGANFTKLCKSGNQLSNMFIGPQMIQSFIERAISTFVKLENSLEIFNLYIGIL